MGNTHRSGIFLPASLFFFVGSGKGFKGFGAFSTSEDACPFSFNFESRWNRGGSAALPALRRFLEHLPLSRRTMVVVQLPSLISIRL